MTKDTPRPNDEFLVQHLVDPTDWVSDHERTLCHVCTRQFSTFRRKHHCRMVSLAPVSWAKSSSFGMPLPVI